MIIEGLGLGALAYEMYCADKASKMDEKALKKYAKAFEKNQEARMLVEEKAEYTEQPRQESGSKVFSVSYSLNSSPSRTMPFFMPHSRRTAAVPGLHSQEHLLKTRSHNHPQPFCRL